WGKAEGLNLIDCGPERHPGVAGSVDGRVKIADAERRRARDGWRQNLPGGVDPACGRFCPGRVVLTPPEHPALDGKVLLPEEDDQIPRANRERVPLVHARRRRHRLLHRCVEAKEWPALELDICV